jgi:hypothetical protein
VELQPGIPQGKRSQSSDYFLIKTSSLRALRSSAGSPRPEPVEGRASAVQSPIPASHGSLKTLISWVGDHDPKHVHVFKEGKQVVKWNIEAQVAIEGKATKKIKKLIAELLREGKL